jgi:hypothetical protein
VDPARTAASDRSPRTAPVAPANRVQNPKSKIQNGLVAVLLLVLAVAFMTPGLPP